MLWKQCKYYFLNMTSTVNIVVLEHPWYTLSLSILSLSPIYFNWCCFLFPVSCFLFPVSCFLFPDSCFLLPASCFQCLLDVSDVVTDGCLAWSLSDLKTLCRNINIYSHVNTQVYSKHVSATHSVTYGSLEGQVRNKKKKRSDPNDFSLVFVTSCRLIHFCFHPQWK